MEGSASLTARYTAVSVSLRPKSEPELESFDRDRETDLNGLKQLPLGAAFTIEQHRYSATKGGG